MTEVEALNWWDQVLYLIQAFAMPTTLSRQMLSAITGLRCTYEMWSRPEVKEEEHLAMVSLNFCLEKGGYLMVLLCRMWLRMSVLTGWFAAELYELWRAFYREGSVLQGCSLWEMVLMAGRALFLTQLMRSHGHLFEEAISCIFSLKNCLLASLMHALKYF